MLMRMKTIVISLGGSLLFKGGKLDLGYLGELAGLLVKIKRAGMRLIVVTGGGRRAREFAERARSLKRGEFFADREAIKATRENARALIKIIGREAVPRVLTKFDDGRRSLEKNKIGVGGGMLEGLTTDAVSVLFAEMLGAGAVVNLGDTDGIYSGDPKKVRNAARIGRMRHADLVRLASEHDQRRAGTHFVFDLVGAKLAARSNIELRFADGRDLPEAERAIRGGKFRGTIVTD